MGRIDRIAHDLGLDRGGEDPGYRVVVELPDGGRYLAVPGVSSILFDGDDREPYRPFRPGHDDRDHDGRPIPVETIRVSDLAAVTIRYTPRRPWVWPNIDTAETRALASSYRGSV